MLWSENAKARISEQRHEDVKMRAGSTAPSQLQRCQRHRSCHKRHRFLPRFTASRLTQTHGFNIFSQTRGLNGRFLKNHGFNRLNLRADCWSCKKSKSISAVMIRAAYFQHRGTGTYTSDTAPTQKQRHDTPLYDPYYRLSPGGRSTKPSDMTQAIQIGSVSGSEPHAISRLGLQWVILTRATF